MSNKVYDILKYIALILGYEDKPNKKSSNYSDKDSSVPKNILNAIKNVESITRCLVIFYL